MSLGVGDPAPDFTLPGTGGELATHLLRFFQLFDVRLEATPLGDHYDPETRTARLSPGTVAGLPAKADEVAEGAVVSLRLSDDAATRDLWPQAFEATLTVLLRPGSLQMTLAVHNTGAQPLRFTGALHTYLAVDDIAAVRLGGVQLLLHPQVAARQ